MSATEQIARQYANAHGVRSIWQDIIVNVREWGATGDGKTDDTAALQAAISYANSKNLDVLVPSGTYCYSALIGTITKPIAIEGQGSRLTKFKNISTTYKGYAFEIDDTWYNKAGGTGFSETANEVDYKNENSGLVLRGFAIEGNRTYQQKGINFKNRNDNFIIEDVAVHYLNGIGLNLGDETSAFGLVREARLHNVTIRNCGNATEPAMFLGNSPTVADGTNNIDIYGLRIVYPKGIGLKMKSAGSTLRRIHFFGLFIHGNPAQNQIGNLFEIEGRCDSIDVYGYRTNHSNTGYYCFASKATAGFAPRYINVRGHIDTAHGGIDIQAGSGILLDFRYIFASNIHINVGPDIIGDVSIPHALTGWNIIIDPSVAHRVNQWFGQKSELPLRAQKIVLGSGSLQPAFYEGTGSPESVIVGNVGSIYLDRAAVGDKVGRNVWVKSSGNNTADGWVPLVALTVGTTAQRPVGNTRVGMQYFDTTMNKPIWRNKDNTGWVDATGTNV